MGPDRPGQRDPVGLLVGVVVVALVSVWVAVSLAVIAGYAWRAFQWAAGWT